MKKLILLTTFLACSLAEARVITITIPDTDVYSTCEIKRSSAEWGVNGSVAYSEYFTILVGTNRFGKKTIHQTREVLPSKDSDQGGYESNKEIYNVWKRLIEEGVCPRQ